MQSTLPKVLISLASIFYGVMPVIADLSDSHLLNTNWTPHAKFHLAWLLSTNTLLAILALYLLWFAGRALLAGVIGLSVMAGFWIASLTKSTFGGAFADPDLPVSDIVGLHPNVFAFIFVTGFLAVGMYLQYRSTKKSE